MGGANGSSNGRPKQSWAMLGSNLSELLHDMTTIVELQAKLTLHDLRASARRARGPLAVCLAAMLVLVGAAPIALAAAAEALVAYAAWTRPPAYLATAAVAGVVALVALWLAAAALRGSTQPLERSQRELAENVRWLRRAIRAQGGARRRQQQARQSKQPNT